MAKSKFEYVKKFEVHAYDSLLLNCWIVIRVDGKCFHRFSEVHSLRKPNDRRALNLMSAAAKAVMCEFGDIIIAYGQSDEYSFVLKKSSNTYNRRASKLLSLVVSSFTANFMFHWPAFFTDQEMKYPCTFDGRLVLYPSDINLRDYLSWRQADCHINNLYNTCFWALVQNGNMSRKEAEIRLKTTLAADKNEILFSEFGVNYNNEPALFRKGTVLLRNSSDDAGNVDRIVESNEDLIGETFWKKYSTTLT